MFLPRVLCQYNHRVCECTLTSLPSFHLGTTNTKSDSMYCCFEIVTSSLYSYLLTPPSSVLLEKLICCQQVKKFPAFYGTRRFNTAFTNTRHLSISWANSIQSMLPHSTSWSSILILSSLLCLGLPSGLFPSGLLSKTLYTPLLSQIYATCPAHAILFKFLPYIFLSVIRLYGIISYVAVTSLKKYDCTGVISLYTLQKLNHMHLKKSCRCRQIYDYINPYPTAFPYGNGMVLHFYQQQESSTTKTVHKVINKGLKTYV